MELTVIRILVLLFSVVVHEVAHGWTAWKLGDPTAREAGRLTLNPLPHIDPVGSILVPLMLSFTGTIMLGWARPVPVNPRRLNNPRDDHPKVAAAGPLSNLLLALISAILLGGIVAVGGMPAGGVHGHAGEPTLQLFLIQLFQMGVLINVVLALFNLLPLPPLDGSWIVLRFLGPAARVRYLELHRYGLLLVVGFLLLLRYTPVGDLVTRGMAGAVEPFFRISILLAGLGG